jgi:hypothetical protein
MSKWDAPVSYRRAYTLQEISFLIEKSGISATVDPFLPIGYSITYEI